MEHIIRICMGSSCYVRENKENLEIIRKWIADRDLTNSVRITGTLCSGHCGEGPNIFIDEQRFSQVNPETVEYILKQTIQNK
jgi:NADH:ubiquinone oxidoreductase subunit E